MHHKANLPPQPPGAVEIKKFGVLLKCDTAGTQEAISAGLAAIQEPGVAIAIIQSGAGKVSNFLRIHHLKTDNWADTRNLKPITRLHISSLQN